MKHLSTNLLGLLGISLTFTVSLGWADCKTEGFRRTNFILSASEADETHKQINQNHRAFCKELRDRLHQSCDTKTPAKECKCIGSPDFINGCREALTTRGLVEGDCAKQNSPLNAQEKLNRLRLIIEEADQVLSQNPASKDAKLAKESAIKEARLLIEEMNQQKETLAQEQKKLAAEKEKIEQAKKDIERLGDLKGQLRQDLLKESLDDKDKQQIRENFAEALQIKGRKDARKRAEGIPALLPTEEGQRLLKKLETNLVKQDINTDQRIELGSQIQEASNRRTEKLKEKYECELLHGTGHKECANHLEALSAQDRELRNLKTRKNKLEKSHETLIAMFSEYAAQAIEERKRQKKEAREKRSARIAKKLETYKKETPARKQEEQEKVQEKIKDAPVASTPPAPISTAVSSPEVTNTNKAQPQKGPEERRKEMPEERDETLEVLEATAKELGLPPPNLDQYKTGPVLQSRSLSEKRPTPLRKTPLRAQLESLKTASKSQPQTPAKTEPKMKVEPTEETPVSQLVSGDFYPKARGSNPQEELNAMTKLLKGKPPGTYIRLKNPRDEDEEDLYYVKNDLEISSLRSIRESGLIMPKIKTWKNLYSK